MAEYIEREALLFKLCNELSTYGSPNPKITPISFGSMLGMQGAVAFVAYFPAADVVEVVRCKDCKYCRTLKDGGCQCERIDGLLMPKPNDFCSYAKRREE